MKRHFALPFRHRRMPLLSYCVCALILSGGLLASAATAAEPARLWTYPPIFDYRTDPTVEYKSVNIFGPFLKYEEKGGEVDHAFRPLFYLSSDRDRQAAHFDLLFPVLTYKHDNESTSYRFLFLFNYYSNRDDDYSQRNTSLFPLFYYKKKNEAQTEYSVFPFVGHFYNKFNRDEIRYTLFPLYAHTKRKGTHVDNYLWPFFASISGDDPAETGFKFWPLYGYSRRPGIYRKSMTLWPFWISEDVALDSDNPVTRRYSFPFYLYEESPQLSRRTVLWPFFSYTDDRKQGYTEWTFPWPLFAYAEGEHRHGYKALPLISDMTTNGTRTRYLLWPILKVEDQKIGSLQQHRTRILFLLYTDLYEREEGETVNRRERRLFWPLFGYRYEKGVSHFYALALLEPLFQQSEGLVRNWSPLWRIYQRKWDTRGNSVTSLLWNIYWHERGPTGVAWELFPLFSYRHEDGRAAEWAVLKGLVSLESDGPDSRLHLLYLPWGIRLGAAHMQ